MNNDSMKSLQTKLLPVARNSGENLTQQRVTHLEEASAIKSDQLKEVTKALRTHKKAIDSHGERISDLEKSNFLSPDQMRAIKDKFIEHYLRSSESTICMGVMERDEKRIPVVKSSVNLTIMRTQIQYEDGNEKTNSLTYKSGNGDVENQMHAKSDSSNEQKWKKWDVNNNSERGKKESKVLPKEIFNKKFCEVIKCKENEKFDPSGEAIFYKQEGEILRFAWSDGDHIKNDKFITHDSHPKLMDTLLKMTTEKSSDPSLVAEIINACGINKALCRRVSLKGVPGSGKSVLSRYLACLWAEGTLWQDTFQWVIYLRLHEVRDYFKNNPNSEINDYLYDKYFRDTTLATTNDEKRELCQKFWYTLQHQDAKILFLLDGYDEIFSDIDKYSACKELVEIANSQEFKHFYVLMASRHYVMPFVGARDIHILENMGLQPEQVNEYIGKYFSVETSLTEQKIAEDVDSLEKFLDKHKILRQSCCTPIYLAILCDLWADPETRKRIENKNSVKIATLYHLMMIMKLKSFLIKNKSKLSVLNDFTESDIEKFDDMKIFELAIVKDVLTFVELIAYETFKEGSRNISEEVFNKCLKTITPYKQQQALLKACPFLNYSGKDATFIHLTFQEFFFARYFASKIFGNGLTQSDKWFIADNKYNPRYLLIWAYVSGIVSQHENKIIKEEALKKYFQILIESPRDLFGFYEKELLLKCENEAECMGLFSNLYLPLVLSKRHFSDSSILTFYERLYFSAQCLRCFSYLPFAVLNYENINRLSNLSLIIDIFIQIFLVFSNIYFAFINNIFVLPEYALIFMFVVQFTFYVMKTFPLCGFLVDKNLYIDVDTRFVQGNDLINMKDILMLRAHWLVSNAMYFSIYTSLIFFTFFYNNAKFLFSAVFIFIINAYLFSYAVTVLHESREHSALAFYAYRLFLPLLIIAAALMNNPGDFRDSFMEFFLFKSPVIISILEYFKKYNYSYIPGFQDCLVCILEEIFLKYKTAIWEVGKGQREIKMLSSSSAVVNDHDTIFLYQENNSITACWMKDDVQKFKTLPLDKIDESIKKLNPDQSSSDKTLITKASSQFGCTFNQFAWYENEKLHRFSCDNPNTLIRDIKRSRIFDDPFEKKWSAWFFSSKVQSNNLVAQNGSISYARD